MKIYTVHKCKLYYDDGDCYDHFVYQLYGIFLSLDNAIKCAATLFNEDTRIPEANIYEMEIGFPVKKYNYSILRSYKIM